MSKVTYKHNRASFYRALRKDINAYFLEKNIDKKGNWRLYSKTIILLTSSFLLYALIMFVPMPGVLSIFLIILLGIALTLVGFNVMHDACHGSYSKSKKLNETLGYTLNLIGANSFLWKHKHNVLHHTYTNVDGKDDDIAQSPFLRMCSTQKWTPAHKIQHIYLPFLYAGSISYWFLWQDFFKYFSKKTHNSGLPKMSRKEHIVFWVSKAFYGFAYIALPIMLHGWADWLIAYAILNAIMGLGTSIVFQLAHVVEETSFVYVGIEDDVVIENEWAVHQIKTTANFSPGNKFLTYILGGLNYQVEHHLFPQISHIHYPYLSKIVKKKCKEFDIPYLSSPTFFKALSSHFKLIKQMGATPSHI